MIEKDDPRGLAVLNFQRLISIHFYTSSVEKFLQARLHFASRGYELKSFRGPREPYDEDYTLGTRELLRSAVKQVISEFGVRSMFFVEDTSLRIEALSTERDFPGVSLKEWFSGTTFQELDRALRPHGNDRRATAKSDIALYVPSLNTPVYFHGEISGVVAETPPSFEVSAQYPWLSPDNFGGWFIPNGATRRIGEMSYEESLRYDFRIRSFSCLLDYLETMHAGLNLQPQFYEVQRRAPSLGAQASLFQPDRPVILLLCGYKCSGKTTLMQYLGRGDDVLTIEGSRFIQSLAARLGAPLASTEDALKLLAEHGWDAASAEISDFIELRRPNICVVSGCRSPEDIAHFKRRFPNTTSILIEADPKLRFERHLARSRDPHLGTMRQFLETDAEQDVFGFTRVGRTLADVVIRNEGDLVTFHHSIERVMEQILDGSSLCAPPAGSAPSALHAALRTLHEHGGSTPSSELSEALRVGNHSWPGTRARLAGLGDFVSTMQIGGVISYSLTKRGYSLLEAFDRSSRAS